MEATAISRMLAATAELSAVILFIGMILIVADALQFA